MSDYSSLKATINANVKANNNHEITGSIMNSVLNAMVDSLGAGYQFIGVATPTNPVSAQTPDYKCFYLATTPGTYTNLGGLVVADGEVALLKYDTTWTKEVTGIASADKLNQLGQKQQQVSSIVLTGGVYDGASFINPGIIQDNGNKVDTSASDYRRTDVITILPNQVITVKSYGSTSLNALALYGNNTYGKFQKVQKLPISEDGFGVVTYKNKTGHTLYLVATSHKDQLNESYVKIDNSYPSENEEIGINDIYHERGVCLFSSKTYVANDNSPYVTYFIPVMENQMVYMKGGCYPSGFQIFACNDNHEYVESIVNVRGADNLSSPGSLSPYKLTYAIPAGVTMIGITNRADEYTTPDVARYPDNAIIDSKIRPLVKDYNLSPQKGHIAFVVDGGYKDDLTLKDFFESKGIKAGWALMWPILIPGYYDAGKYYDKYLDWQNNGHEILVHSGPAQTWNGQDYSVPSNAADQAAFAQMRFEQFMGIGWKVRGFCQSGSQKFPTEQERKPVYNSFEYAFTRATNEITDPDGGAVMMPTDMPWNLGRSTLEVITLAQMKGLIDECASKKGLLVIYCHSWRIGNASYPNQTWANFEEMVDYAKSKCVIDIPYNCIKSLYANHIE